MRERPETSVYYMLTRPATQIVENEATPFEELIDLDPSVESIDSMMGPDTESNIGSEFDSDTDSDADSDSSGEMDGEQIKRHSEGSNISASAGSNPLELPKTLELIRFIINCLYKMPIRRPAALERITERIRDKFAPYQQYDARFVQDLHPGLDPTIATRLGRLISLRRQILYYQEEHNQKLQLGPIRGGLSAKLIVEAKSEAEAVVYTTLHSEQASGISPPSKATTHLNPPDRPNLQKFEFPPSVASSHLSRASTYAINSIGLPIPPIPKNPDGTPLTNFLCPYCKITHYIKTERSWKKHVLRDLKPYVCTFSGCSSQDHFFASRNEWYLHETQEHRCEWHCNVEGHDICNTQEQFMNHMSESHGTELSLDQMANLAPMFRRAHRSSARRCNLCNKKSKSLCDHVARHLERIALFALPRPSNDDADLESSQNQQSLEALHSYNGSLSASVEHESSDKASVSQSTSHVPGRVADPSLLGDGEELSDGFENLVPDSEDTNRDVFATKFSGQPDLLGGRPTLSLLQTSVNLARESQVEQLARELRKAVGRTVENIPQRDRQSRRFLPKNDLARILTDKSLDLLFRELVCVQSSSGVVDVPQAITSDVADEQNDPCPTCADEIIEKCIQATTGTPSRMSLIALFLYQDRPELLLLFLEWLTSEFDQHAAEHDHFIPSDESMPFTELELFDYRVPKRYHASILEEQASFKPLTLQKLKHHDISTSERLPFMGSQESIKSGSQGHVVKAVIAESHWEIQEDEAQKDSNFVPGNPNSTRIVALKIFKAVEPVRDMLEATEDFEIELNILKELRKYQTKHEMIMLDLGSITESDDTGSPIRHSLIFELANFSLDDLLKSRNRAREDILPSRLLASLVDIVEVLECLHNKLGTLHLDIKPDNILIFETYSGSERSKQYELTWKLSDFGLARKKAAKKRRVGPAQTSTGTSRKSTLPATRPTGLYQAPEIQEQETSQAGQGSDVWSIGCITLMVLAFITDGSEAVMGLETFLMVDFLERGDREPLFYISSDSYLWEDRTAYACCYLPDQTPNADIIPGTGKQLSAALHPHLIYWSNRLLRASYDRRPAQRFVLDLLKVVFGTVLRVDRNQRIGATELRDRLAEIQQDWKSYDLAPGSYEYRDISAELYLPQNRRSQERMTQTRDSAVATQEQVQAQAETTAPHVEMKVTQMQQQLCYAIERDDAVSVRLLLERNPEMLSQLCPGAGRYPIHRALFKNTYNALEALLEKASLDITNLTCSRRTALDLALDSGKAAALDCIRKHRDKFDFPPELYKKRKNGLGSEARKIADDLFGIKKAATSKGWNLFSFKGSKRSNSST